MKGEIKLFIEIDGNIYNSINISSVREVEETVDSSTVYKVITVFKNGRQIIEEYDNKSDADDEYEKILASGPSGGGGDMSNYYTKDEINQRDESLLTSAVGTFIKSASSSTDVGTNSSKRLNFSSYTPGEYVFYNYSTMSSLYYSVITSDSNVSEGDFTTGRNTYMFKLKMILDVTEGISSYDAGTTIGYITFYDFSNYSEVTYRLYITSQSKIATDTMSSLASSSEMSTAIKSVNSLPTADSTYSGKIYQYKGTTNQNYTKGYFYICNNSTGSYAWHQIDVQPSSSGGQVYQHISTASSDDFGRTSANAIDFTTLQKGTHIFKNVSTSNKLYYKYKKTSSSSYTSTSFTYGNSYTSGNQYSTYFIIEIFEDMSGGIYELNLDNGYTVALISVYVNSNYSKLVYSMVIIDKTTGTIDYGTRSNLASSSQLRSVYQTANSASSTANQNTQSISALDTRVTALEQGGGGSGGQTEYVTDYGGISYPPSIMWSSSSNSFTYAKNTAEFKEGASEFIDVNLYVDQMYNDKTDVEMSYIYSTAMLDTSDVIIPNVVLKIYSTYDDSELSSIDVGNVTLAYDSMSNKWKFSKYGVSFTSVMSGQNVYCKLFYGGSEESSVTDASTYISVGGMAAEFKYSAIKTDIADKGFMQMYYIPNSLEWSMFYSGTNYDGTIIPLYGSSGFYVEAFIGNKMSGSDTFELVLLVHPNNNTVYKIIVSQNDTVSVYYLNFQSTSV